MNTDTAIILAAGYGSRLDAEVSHKLLVSIGGRPLLGHHARNFARLGVQRLIVVTGYRGDELQRAIDGVDILEPISIDCVHNPNFDDGNGHSVLAGARALDDGRPSAPFFVTMSDHIYEPDLFDDIRRQFPDGLHADCDGALFVDRKLETIFDMPDATKLRFDSPLRIGKELGDFDAVDTGLFWCRRPFVDALQSALDERGDCSTSDSVRALHGADRFRFIDVGDRLWQDVDTAGARRHAEQLWNCDFDLGEISTQ